MPPLFSSPFTASRALPCLGRSAEVADHGVSCAGCHLAKFRELTQRYQGQTMDWVVPSWAVRDLGKARDWAGVLYSREGFLEHFK